MARRTKTPKAKPRYAWEVSGVHVWFHYTNADIARQIDREQRFVVSSRPHQRYGTGLFVTTIQPGEMSEEDLLKHLFAMQRSPDNVEAVIVLLRDAQVLPVKAAGSRQYVHPALAAAEIDISLIYLGYGYREDTREGWMFSRGIYMSET
jgi:hypothetical protein